MDPAGVGGVERPFRRDQVDHDRGAVLVGVERVADMDGVDVQPAHVAARARAISRHHAMLGTDQP
jgi:hypothetical protein